MTAARVAEFLEQALVHDAAGRTLVDVISRIASGEAHLWAGDRSAAVTEWIYYGERKVLNIWLSGGDIAELFGSLLPTAERWALQHGASAVACGVYDRRGWQRLLAKAGFDPGWQVFFKELVQ